MLAEQLKNVFDQFKHNAQYVNYKIISSGHINDTYLIETTKKPYFVLQRINHGVFKDIPRLIENKVAISRHIKVKIANESKIKHGNG